METLESSPGRSLDSEDLIAVKRLGAYLRSRWFELPPYLRDRGHQLGLVEISERVTGPENFRPENIEDSTVAIGVSELAEEPNA